MKFHKTLLKPKCDLLISFCIAKKVDDETKKKEIKRFEAQLKEMEKLLTEMKSDYFSGCD